MGMYIRYFVALKTCFRSERISPEPLFPGVDRNYFITYVVDDAPLLLYEGGSVDQQMEQDIQFAHARTRGSERLVTRQPPSRVALSETQSRRRRRRSRDVRVQDETTRGVEGHARRVSHRYDTSSIFFTCVSSVSVFPTRVTLIFLNSVFV